MLLCYITVRFLSGPVSMFWEVEQCSAPTEDSGNGFSCQGVEASNAVKFFGGLNRIFTTMAFFCDDMDQNWAVEFFDALQRHDSLCILYNAYYVLVATGILANRTQLCIAEILANTAAPNIAFGSKHSIRKRLCVSIRKIKHGKC